MSPDVASDRRLAPLCVALGGAWVVAQLPAPAATFTNPDDWYHLAAASAVASGEEGSWLALLRGEELRSFRAVSSLLWLVEWLVYGFRPRAYLVTNYLLGGLLVGLAAALTGRLAQLAGGHRTEPGASRAPLLAAVVAATVVGCAPDLQTAASFLAGRDDYLVTVFALVAALLWLGDRGRWRALACVALLLGLFSKPVLLVGPALLVLVDAGTGRLPRRPAPLIVRYLPPVLCVLAYLVVAGGFVVDQAGHRPPGGEASPLALVVAVTSVLFDPFRSPGPSVAAMPLARAVLLIGAVGLGLAAGAARWRAALVGLGWLVVMAAPVVFTFAGRPETLRSEARYLLPAAVGFAIAAGGLVGGPATRWPRVGKALAGATLIAAAAAWIGWYGVNPRAGQVSVNAALVRALPELSAGLSDAPGVLIAVRHFDDGLLAALASPALQGLGEEPGDRRFFMEGAGRVFGTTAGESPDPARRYGRAERLNLDEELSDGTALVADVGRPGAPHFVIVSPPPPHRTPRAPLPGWPGLRGWDGPSPLPWSGPANPRELSVRPPDPATWRSHLRSPAVNLDPATVCGLRVRHALPRWGPVEESPWNRVMRRPTYLLLTWQEEPVVERWSRFVVAVFDSRTRQTRFDLGNSPTWRRSGRVRRLTVASALPGPLEVRGVTLEPCSD